MEELLKQIVTQEELEAIGKLMSLTDEEFKLISPYILNEIDHVYSKPMIINEIIAGLHSNGIDERELLQVHDEYIKLINAQENLSQIKKDFCIQVVNLMLNSVQNHITDRQEFVSIPIEFIHPDAKLPTYANVGDAGMDVYALDDYMIKPGETKIIPLGFKVAIPTGYELQVRPKSGLTSRSTLRIANAPGTIDSGYRDEVGVIVENVASPINDIVLDADLNIACGIEYGAACSISKGQKFAQLVLQKVPTASFQVVESVASIVGDRGGGYGSTGEF